MLLKKEFTDLEVLELPSYNISYPKKGQSLKFKLLKDTPHILKTIGKEKRLIENYVQNNKIDGIISDNRFGVRHKSVPSIFITHQLKVLSGNTTWLSSKIHQKIIEKFDQLWIPDHQGEHNLSGDLGHIDTYKSNIKYIGPLSRFEKQNLKKVYAIMVLLSGPEPQRTYLENKLLDELSEQEVSVLFVRGVIEATQSVTQIKNITLYNYMESNALETAINSSDLIISRSGYTTIMDLAKLKKKAFFIPTPGQFEQVYLAKRLTENFMIPSCSQDEFTFNHLQNKDTYKGFSEMDYETNFKKLFSLF